MSEVRAETVVALPPQAAFDLFCDTGRWWPLVNSFSRPFAEAAIEPHAGGAWYEVDGQGRRQDWGAVHVFEPGRRLLLAWGVTLQGEVEAPERSSTVEVAFEPQDGGARVMVRHSGWERHGEGWEAYRDGMASPAGWPCLLAEFARAARLRS